MTKLSKQAEKESPVQKAGRIERKNLGHFLSTVEIENAQFSPIEAD